MRVGSECRNEDRIEHDRAPDADICSGWRDANLVRRNHGGVIPESSTAARQHSRHDAQTGVRAQMDGRQVDGPLSAIPTPKVPEFRRDLPVLIAPSRGGLWLVVRDSGRTIDVTRYLTFNHTRRDENASKWGYRPTVATRRHRRIGRTNDWSSSMPWRWSHTSGMRCGSVRRGSDSPATSGRSIRQARTRSSTRCGT